jgi:hypothetical protein
MMGSASERRKDIEMDETKLKVGSFYWMLPVLDPDTDNQWENEPQPARYEGDGKWTCLGIDGISDWPARWIGDEITPPQR